MAEQTERDELEAAARLLQSQPVVVRRVDILDLPPLLIADLRNEERRSHGIGATISPSMLRVARQILGADSP